MQAINIKHFGPIEDGFDGAMPIMPITIFCGNQGSGKSTIAKVISTFSWMEKALMRGDIVSNKRTNNPKYIKHQFEFQRIHNYFRKNTELHFSGIQYDFHYENEAFSIVEKENPKEFLMPKIMYIPAERNFLTVVEHPEILKEIPASLFALFVEYDNARKSLKRDFHLPVDGFFFQYDKLNNVSWLKGDNFKVRVSEAASGFQSLIPLVLVSRYMLHVIDKGQVAYVNAKQVDKINKRIAQILADNTITDDTRKLLIAQQSSLSKYGRFVNIVEEPEQNLFPSSQKDVLFDLFEAFNSSKNNQLIITTHSPYLIDYTTLAIKAHSLNANQERAKEISTIVPQNAWINGNDVCVYQIENGKISPLKKYDNMPSDDNFLNQELSNTNELFAQLLEMEE